MKRALVRSVLFWGLVTAALGACADDVLYFMVDNPTLQDKFGVTYRASEAGAHGRTITDARVAAYGPDEGAVVYLDLYYWDGAASRWTVDYTANPRVDSAWIDNGIMGGGSDAAYSMASLGTPELKGDLSKYSFAIELGTWSGDDTWVSAALSETKTYQELQTYVGSELSVQTQQIWNPAVYSTPEPSGGLLFALGLGLLALRRRRIET